MKKIKFAPQGSVGRFFDWLMKPIMYWLQGDWVEEPQRTHFWNNVKLAKSEIRDLNVSEMIECEACKSKAPVRWKWGFVPIFHMPRFGGWKKYVCISSDWSVGQDWYIGWICEDGTIGLSLVPIKPSKRPRFGGYRSKGDIRVLIGPCRVKFFGLTSDGVQIDICIIDFGEIGDKKFPDVPLL